ncbi:MAG: type III-A CRISPR-associated protein Csm2 [Candidatus Goldbacteria bacterium]|nr:type III-A CRISPR-associated protein Csm2 [Candidatus Goldiibacteriota bacterium]
MADGRDYKRNESRGQQQTVNIKYYFQNVNLDELKADDITTATKQFSEELCRKDFKSNQLRKFYNEIMALKSKYQPPITDNQLKLDLAIFLSKIEYGKNKAKKEEKLSFEFYLKNIESIIKKVNNEKNFNNLITIMEAIVAYFPKQK